jgi:hypothetical protein
MLDSEFHISKAKRNKDLLSWFTANSCQYNEWLVTVMFYVCVHYVDAILHKDEKISAIAADPGDHKTRNNAVGKNKYLRVRSDEYYELYKRSRDARYNDLYFEDSDFLKIQNNLYRPLQRYLFNKAEEVCGVHG